MPWVGFVPQTALCPHPGSDGLFGMANLGWFGHWLILGGGTIDRRRGVLALGNKYTYASEGTAWYRTYWLNVL